jgi:hypothetical protein
VGESELKATKVPVPITDSCFTPGAYQTAELDERLARIEHLVDAQTGISGGGFEFVL